MSRTKHVMMQALFGVLILPPKAHAPVMNNTNAKNVLKLKNILFILKTSMFLYFFVCGSFTEKRKLGG
jgi:hypothetical protein